MRIAILTRTLAGCVAACLAACATQPVAAPPRMLLLGEIHDHVEGHRLRLASLQARLDSGWRPAIAMEQFDTPVQPALTAAQARCGLDARCIIDAAGRSATWDWSFYEPVIVLAQRHGLPLLAANLAHEAAVSIVQGKPIGGADGARLAHYPLQAPPADVMAKQIEAVRDGHCGLLPESLLPKMARAQIARDMVMADVLQHAGRDVVLLAGNGHVRRDLGVPRWLAAGQIESIGYSEEAATAGSFDHEILVGPQSRPDPCAALVPPVAN